MRAGPCSIHPSPRIDAVPRVSVVIPAFDARRFVDETLDSVLAQRGADFDVTVVDDGSSDGTADRVAARGDARLLRRENRGPAAARNAGAALGDSEWIAFCDADDLWAPDKLRRQLEAAEARPGAVLVASGGEEFGARAGSLPAPREGRVTGELIAENFITTSSVLVRREAYVRAGGFDESPALISVEDYDLWLRLSLSGELAGVAEPLVRRRAHDRNLSADHLDLSRKTLLVLERLERTLAPDAYAVELRRRRAALEYGLGRAFLGRGETDAGRRALRRARALEPARTAPALALELVSWLPGRWLRRLRQARRP